MHINGQWEGELKGKVGHFPFPFVEFIDQIEGGGNDLNNEFDTSNSSHNVNNSSSFNLNNSASLVEGQMGGQKE